jgi:hypothetical protein
MEKCVSFPGAKQTLTNSNLDEFSMQRVGAFHQLPRLFYS